MAGRGMEGVAECLWSLADVHETRGCLGEALKCLEAICQSSVSFLPIVEVKTRLRIATLLLNHTDNVTHAKNHLERAQLLLKQIPSCFELKCRAYSLLSRCYHLVGTIPPQKQTLRKGLELALSAMEGESAHLWACNFNLQLANALTVEGDFPNSVRALESGLQFAEKTARTDLKMLFATSILHVQLMQWEDPMAVEQAVTNCDEIWNSISLEQRRSCLGLHLYNELLHTFYFLRICDYKEASQHVENLDAALNSNSPQEVNPAENHSAKKKKNEHIGEGKQVLEGPTSEDASSANAEDKLELGPPPLDGEWLPRSAICGLVDLMAVVCYRPKGMFKECGKRLLSGISGVKDELAKLGITEDAKGLKLGVLKWVSEVFSTRKEVDIQHWAIWVAGVFLILLLQLLENKVIIDLTRTEFLDAQQGLMEMIDLFSRFPTILQDCETTIHTLLGQYAHSVGCFKDASSHFLEAAKLTESKGTQAMSHIYAAVSLICLGDAESSSQALDLIGPIYRTMDSYVGVREKTGVLFASGLLQMKQHNLQEARTRLANGLKLTHKQLGNHQLLSQYLTVLGSLALALHDTGQARDILKSSLTLAKALHDIPTQIGVLSELTALYRELGEFTKGLENSEYESRKMEDLKKRIEVAQASKVHSQLLEVALLINELEE